MQLHTDHVWTYIHGTIPRHIVDPVTSYFVDGAWFAKAYKRGHWDGYVRFIEHDRKKKLYRFPSGFLHRVTAALDAADYPYTLQDSRDYESIIPICELLSHEGPIRLDEGKWDFQARVLGQALAHGRGVVQVATGGGKTEIGAAMFRSCLESIGGPVIWLTHRQNLMYQTYYRFCERLGTEVGLIGDGYYAFKDVNVVMVQTASKFKDAGKEKLRELFANAKMVIGDEIHHLESDQWYELFSTIQAPYRFGLTATPTLTGPGLALLGMTGEIICEVDIIELLERRVLVPPRIWFISCDSPKLLDSTPYQTAYSEGIVKNEDRNNMICMVAGVFRDEEKSTLILVKRINHGEHLTDLLCSKGVRADLIQGKVSQEDRSIILEKLYDKKLDAVVAIAETMGEGVDLPKLDAVINATGAKGGGSKKEGESGRQTIQILGRIIRASPGKKYADYVDIADRTHKSLKRASLDRAETLEAEGYGPFIRYWKDYVPEDT